MAGVGAHQWSDSSSPQPVREIESKTIRLFALVADDLAGATHALLSGDNDLFQILAEREQVIDDLYVEIEELANHQIAQMAVGPDDLRLLLSVLRIVPELERSHDLVVHIARYADHGLSAEMTPRCRGIVERMGAIGAEMWRHAAESWYDKDRYAAERLDERDEDLDSLHAALIAELASGKMSVPVTMDMTLVARFFERLGDHAVNVARRVEFLAGPGPTG